MQIVNSKYFLQKINDLRKADIQNFQTNYFLNKLNDEIECFENDDAIIVLTKDKSIFRLYFAFINLHNFEKLLMLIPQDIKVSLELITKKEIDENLYNCINKYLIHETIYERMRAECTSIKKSKLHTEKEIEYATKNDVQIISDKLNEKFNHHTSHLPDEQDLSELIKNKQIICVKNNNELAGIIIYKFEGNQIRFDQFLSFNNNTQDTLKLWDYFVSKLLLLNAKTCYLWVDTIYNKRALAFYKYYGYKYDNKKSYIFINNELSKIIKH